MVKGHTLVIMETNGLLLMEPFESQLNMVFVVENFRTSVMVSIDFLSAGKS